MINIALESEWSLYIMIFVFDWMPTIIKIGLSVIKYEYNFIEKVQLYDSIRIDNWFLKKSLKTVLSYLYILLVLYFKLMNSFLLSLFSKCTAHFFLIHEKSRCVLMYFYCIYWCVQANMSDMEWCYKNALM